MPRLTDPAEIRAILETDRPWAAYALGDLSPGFFEHCQWFGSAPNSLPGLALLYGAFETPVLFTLGQSEIVQFLLDEIPRKPKMYLSIRPEILPLIKAQYRVESEQAMWRMVLELSAFRPVTAERVARLGPPDLPALQGLYADGQATGEAPDFFSSEMLEQGVFFGIYESDELTAAAGTHLVVSAEGVAAIGNVYTRRDRRGRGLARLVTSAVAAELLHRPGLTTIVLNVNQVNSAAIRVYDGLGFVRYCPFYEGLAVRA
jgi:RimJ/RimL family protein N-acetyltransferase